MMVEINWDLASKQDYQLAHQIVERFVVLSMPYNIDRLSLQMDIIAVHIGGCKLKLQELLESDQSDFLHDVWGTRKHIDRSTGILQDRFRPRYAV